MSKTHNVKQGDTMISIANEYGYNNWKYIWGCDENAQLRTTRPDPMALLPGDKVVIPPKKMREYRCRTRREYVFRTESLKAMFRIIIEDDDGMPYSQKEYQLEVDGKKLEKAKTGINGMVEHKVPPDAKKGTLTLWPDDNDENITKQWDVNFGYLDPISEDSGIVARLNNLGYDAGSEDNIDKDKLADAVASFQRDHKYEPTGKLDKALRRIIEEAHEA